jgi:uncharacterized protein (TIGR03083 family)
MNKASLLATIEAEYAQFEAILAQVAPEQMTAPGVEDTWSVKDVLAHLTFWQQRMRTILEAALRGERLQRPVTALEAGLAEGPDWMDQLNARAVAAQRERPWPELLADLRRSHQETIALLASISEDDLRDPRRIEAVIDGYGSLQALIEGDTSEHYQEHSASIQAWLEQTRHRRESAAQQA